MPKGFRNINLNQRDPNRRRGAGPPPPPPVRTGFRPSHEKNRPPNWTPPEPPKPEPGTEAAKPKDADKPAKPEKK